MIKLLLPVHFIVATLGQFTYASEHPVSEGSYQGVIKESPFAGRSCEVLITDSKSLSSSPDVLVYPGDVDIEIKSGNKRIAIAQFVNGSSLDPSDLGGEDPILSRSELDTGVVGKFLEQSPSHEDKTNPRLKLSRLISIQILNFKTDESVTCDRLEKINLK